MNQVLVEGIVLITIGWLSTLYAWRQKWLRQQQAWQWWHRQQAMQSHHTAEAIRDGLLQQTFAFRRYLEIAGEAAEATSGKTTESAASENPQPHSAAETARWLERFQTFYQSLETLSDELSPPFLADSLPLALQFTLKNWQPPGQSPGQLPGQSSGRQAACPQLQFQLPQDWPHSNAEENQVILSIAIALLTILLPQSHTTDPITVSLTHDLTHDNGRNTLSLTIGKDPTHTTSKVLALAELQHLKEIFHSLIGGQLEIKETDTTLTSNLHWQPSLAK